jgi:hypothetical protein
MQNKEPVGVRPTKTPTSLCVIVSRHARTTHNDLKFCETVESWRGDYVVAESSGSELEDEWLLLKPYRSRKR